MPAQINSDLAQAEDLAEDLSMWLATRKDAPAWVGDAIDGIRACVAEALYALTTPAA